MKNFDKIVGILLIVYGVVFSIQFYFSILEISDDRSQSVNFILIYGATIINQFLAIAAGTFLLLSKRIGWALGLGVSINVFIGSFLSFFKFINTDKNISIYFLSIEVFKFAFMGLLIGILLSRTSHSKSKISVSQWVIILSVILFYFLYKVVIRSLN